METTRYPALPVVIVDDERAAISGSEFTLRSAGVTHVVGIEDGRELLPALAERGASVVLLDLTLPHISGQDLLPQLAQGFPDVPVIVVTGLNEIETAIECMKAGAFDYMVKPVEANRLISGVRRAIELGELRHEYDSFKERVFADDLEHPEAFADIVTNNGALRSVFQYVETIATTSRPVLVTGETGSGKELLARAIHALSGRPGLFVAVNAAGLDDNVFSDTLFGHLRGAFTGADATREGLIERAAGGTLFLDEIGDLSHTSQAKLLRLVQEREYFPLGADVPKESDARIVVATNRGLAELEEAGRFRSDLYYRLRAHHVHLPPLRDRLDDLPVLLDHFLEEAAKALGKKKPTPPRELVTLLAAYRFPGNVRELETMVFDAVSRHKSRTLSTETFKEHIGESLAQDPPLPKVSGGDTSPFTLFEKLPTLKETPRLLIAEAMRRAGGNQSVAARLLNISQSGLSKALKRSRE